MKFIAFHYTVFTGIRVHRKKGPWALWETCGETETFSNAYHLLSKRNTQYFLRLKTIRNRFYPYEQEVQLFSQLFRCRIKLLLISKLHFLLNFCSYKLSLSDRIVEDENTEFIKISVHGRLNFKVDFIGVTSGNGQLFGWALCCLIFVCFGKIGKQERDKRIICKTHFSNLKVLCKIIE